MKPMDYEQVKKRVEREDKALKAIVLYTGIGMTAAILIAVALFH